MSNTTFNDTRQDRFTSIYSLIGKYNPVDTVTSVTKFDMIYFLSNLAVKHFEVSWEVLKRLLDYTELNKNYSVLESKEAMNIFNYLVYKNFIPSGIYKLIE